MIIRHVLLAALFSAASFIGGYAKIGVQYQTVLGNPSNATTDASNSTNYLLARDEYTISYNDNRSVANWVSWNLTSDDIGTSGRSRVFFADPDLPPSFSVVLPDAYVGSGYDRGHMCPSGDRTISRAVNDITFYMSNMVPQTPDNNQGVWADFENYCRGLADAKNEVLIICGPSHFAGSAIASGVEIPGYVWKVVVVVPLDEANPSRPAIERITPDTRVIAIKIPNIAGVRTDPWSNYIVSPAEIEADTGFNFFRSLSPLLAGLLRNKVDGQTTVGLPIITKHPEFQAPALGGSATFTVQASSATPLSYQWFKDSDDIPGATGSSLTINGVTLNDAGSYYVVVSNAVGSSTSSAATLVVSGLPPTIVSHPVAPATSPAGSTVTLSVGVTGSQPFTYQWLFNGAPIEDSNTGALVLTNVQSGHTGAYEVIVGNGVDTVMSNVANVVVTPSAPTFTKHPTAASGTVGGTVTLTAHAIGSDPISYAWTRNGAPLTDSATVSGAATATLTLSSLTSGAAGDYRCIATNAIDATTSNAAAVTVSAATIFWDFTNDGVPSGLPSDILGGVLTRGNHYITTQTPNAVFEAVSVSPYSGGKNAGVAARTDALAGGALKTGPDGSAYFEFTLQPVSGKKLTITGLSFGARSTGTGPNSYTILTSLDGFANPVATGALRSVSTDTTWRMVTPALSPITSLTGTPVTVRLYGHGGTGTPQPNTTNWRIDDLRAVVTTVASTGGTAPTVSSVSPEPSAAAVAVNSPIKVTFDQPVNVSTGWFTISSLLNGPIAATVTGGPTTFTLTPPVGFSFGDVITTTIHGSAVVEKDTGTLAMAGTHTWSFSTAVPVLPGIVAGPTSQTVADGGSATFSVLASGSAPLSYQWRFNGFPILTNPTATTANLVISPVTSAHAGTYSVVVTNPAGSATSAGASLAVTLVAPEITQQPSSQLGLVGGSADFSVVATGSSPLFYQWFLDGTPLENSARVSGAKSASLSIAGITPDDAGLIEVVVSNTAGTASSNRVSLGVTAASFSTTKWTFGAALPGTAGPTTALPAFVSGGVVSQGNNNGTTPLLSTTSVSSGYTGVSGTVNAGAAARMDSQVGGGLNRNAGGSAYFEFTLSGTDGRQLVVTDLSFGARSTATGPRLYTIYCSADGYARPVATGSLEHNSNSNWRFIEPALSAVRGTPNGSLTFRIYGHGGTNPNPPAAGTANWRIDDLSVTLGVELPPAIASTSPAAGSTGALRHAPVTVAFNQPVAPAAGAFQVSSAATGAVAFTVSGGPSSYLLTPSAAFNYDDTITVAIDGSKVRDVSGTLKMPANYSFSFGVEPALPPSFTQQPESVTVTAFDDASFSVAVSGTGPFTYQWRHNGEDINGANSSILTLPDVLVAQSGDYDCVVKGFAGTATSTKAKLTVEKATASVSLGGLSHVYDGQPKSATVTTAPASLTVVLTYDGGGTLPVNAGSYAVVATVQDENFTGSANGMLSIARASATIVLDGLRQRYDGTPKSVSVTTIPAGLDVLVTYNGDSQAPTLPGSYEVDATIDDENYQGAVMKELTIDITALVRHAPAISGGLDGSIQVLNGETISLSGTSWIAGDLLVPGTPDVRQVGSAKLLGVKDAGGTATPSDFEVRLSGNALLGHLVRRVDAIPMPRVVSAPGSANLAVSNGTSLAVAPGQYGTVTVNGELVLGIESGNEPVAYDFAALVVAGNGSVKVVGPVSITVAQSVTFTTRVGDPAHAGWLVLNVANGGATLSGNAAVAGTIVAPSGTITLSGNATITGSVVADRLVINGNAAIENP